MSYRIAKLPHGTPWAPYGVKEDGVWLDETPRSKTDAQKLIRQFKAWDKSKPKKNPRSAISSGVPRGVWGRAVDALAMFKRAGNAWVEAGRPRSGELYRDFVTAEKEYNTCRNEADKWDWNDEQSAEWKRVNRAFDPLLPGQEGYKANPRSRPAQSKGGVKTIVVAWVENTGIEVTPEMEWRDGIYRNKLKVIPHAVAAMWLNEGTAADVKKAKAHMQSRHAPTLAEWKGVFVYPTSEPEPLKRARKEALAAAAKGKRTLNPHKKGSYVVRAMPPGASSTVVSSHATEGGAQKAARAYKKKHPHLRVYAAPARKSNPRFEMKITPEARGYGIYDNERNRYLAKKGKMLNFETPQRAELLARNAEARLRGPNYSPFSGSGWTEEAWLDTARVTKPKRVSPARARAIIEAARKDAVGPWSDGLNRHMTPAERAFINKVWEKLPGSTSFVGALSTIAQGRSPLRRKRNP